MFRSDHLVWALSLSLALGLLLLAFPLRGELLYWRPPFLLLLVLYWLLMEPYRLGIGFAWLAGLSLDFMFDGIPGQQALALGVCAYLLQLQGDRLRHFSVFHQCILVALLTLIYQLLVTSINLLFYQHNLGWAMLYPVVAALFAWPILVWVLRWLYLPDREVA